MPPSKESSKSVRLPCEKCPYKTIPSEDLVGLVAILEHHQRTDCTGKADVGGPSVESGEFNPGTSKEVEAFQRATAPVVIPEAVDDRVSQFSKGRFLMGPIGWGNLVTQAPLSQEPGDGNMDLWHVGAPLVAQDGNSAP